MSTSMYNKLFTKILDSSIWLESAPTRLVWMTMIAAMDETGFTQFASVANLAHRARVSLEEAEDAVKCLESPDSNSSDPDNEGRRIERVPGGWSVLNAEKYRDMVSRAVIKEQTRIRVASFRERKAGNTPVTQVKRTVTPSDTDSTTPTDSRKTKERKGDPDAVRAYFKEQGLTENDAESMLANWEANGWTIKGEPVKDWRAQVRSWKLRSFHPSQKSNDGKKSSAPVIRDCDMPPPPEPQVSITELIAKNFADQ